MKVFLFLVSLLCFSAAGLQAQIKLITQNKLRSGSKDTSAKTVLMQEAPGLGLFSLVNYLQRYDTINSHELFRDITLVPKYGFYIKRTNEKGKLISKIVIDSVMDNERLTYDMFMTHYISMSNGNDIEYHKMTFVNKDTGFIFITHRYYSYGDLFQPRILRTVNGGRKWEFIPDSNKFISWKGHNMEYDFNMFNSKKGILFYRTNNEFSRDDHQLIEYIITKDGGTKWEYKSFSLNDANDTEWHYYSIKEINYTEAGSIMLTFTARKSSKDEKDRTFTIYSEDFGKHFELQ